MIFRDKYIDQVLEMAEQRFGLGTVSGPRWVRDRVGSFLDGYVERNGGTWDGVVARLATDRTAMNDLVAQLRVGETRFFRDARQMEAMVSYICDKVPAPTPLSVLSAGCSTGEEAYTLGIMLAERARRFTVLAVDRSREAVAKGRSGQYAAEAIRDVPAKLAERYFEVDGEVATVRAPLRSFLTFEPRDLGIRTPRGPFHLIVFKNVLLYLAEPMGTHVATRLARELSSSGLLLSAASEVTRLSACLDPVRIAPGVTGFRPRPEA